MKILIDTNRDSKEEIVRAIRLLESIVGEVSRSVQQKNIFESPSVQPSQGSAFGSFFDNMNPSAQQSPVVKKDNLQRVELY